MKTIEINEASLRQYGRRRHLDTWVLTNRGEPVAALIPIRRGSGIGAYELTHDPAFLVVVARSWATNHGVRAKSPVLRKAQKALKSGDKTQLTAEERTEAADTLRQIARGGEPKIATVFRIHKKRLRANSEIRAYSAGDCSCCSFMGSALFALPVTGGTMFFVCDSCGIAWSRPPSAFPVDAVDPAERFAPAGFRLASLREIRRAGMEAMIVEEVRDEDIADWAKEGHSGTLWPGYQPDRFHRRTASGYLTRRSNGVRIP